MGRDSIDHAAALGTRPMGRLLWHSCSQTTLSVAIYGVYAITNAWVVARRRRCWARAQRIGRRRRPEGRSAAVARQAVQPCGGLQYRARCVEGCEAEWPRSDRVAPKRVVRQVGRGDRGQEVGRRDRLRRGHEKAAERGVELVLWDGWRAIDAAELDLGRAQGRDRVKIADRVELLRAAAGG